MFKKVILFLSGTAFIFSIFTPLFVRADFDCLTVTPNSTAEQKQYCQNQLNDLEKQLADLTAKQQVQKNQAGTLKGDLTLISTQISALKTKVKARSLAIAQLKADITQKVSTIESLSEKIDKEHESLAQLLRKTNELDSDSIIHFALADKTISQFYGDVESFQSIKRAVKSSVDSIGVAKNQTETEKATLVDKQNKELDAKAELETSQKKVTQTEAEKKQLLSITNNNITAYEKQKAEKKAIADKIRAALFNLRDTAAIPFSKALEYANLASSKTGVEAAFVLAILTQESNLGTDQGSCYLTNPTTGEGFGVRRSIVVQNVMKPTRDVAPFLAITQSLGRDPYKTLVSCPIGGYGYGGAMGPAQFIPSTWAGIKSKVASLLGITAPDPWVARDAFMASAAFLADLGAHGTSYSSEIQAACKYYGSGGTSCPYGLNVMAKMKTIQSNIDYLVKNG